MRTCWMLAASLVCVGVLSLPPARAQERGGPPVSYNYARAYRHFMTSPYSYRTMSSLYPGYVTSGYTPSGYATTYVQPGYEQQRITPYGYERYAIVPGSRTYVVPPPPPPGPMIPYYPYP